jgi:hypothetical protein
VDALVKVARKQSTAMNEQQVLSHNHNIRNDLAALGVAVVRIGENTVVAPDLDVANEAFLGSALHYENIVRPNYNALGIGIVADSDGAIWVTQLFAQIAGAAPAPAAPATQAPAPPPSAPPAPEPPKSTPTQAPVPVATTAIERGIVASQLPVKAVGRAWSGYLLASATFALLASASLSIVFAQSVRRSRCSPETLPTDAD